MQTREAISSPTFTGIWYDGFWHVKHKGTYISNFSDMDRAMQCLDRLAKQELLTRINSRLAHAVRLNALRLGQD